jgi:hypothetical protein
MDGESNTYSENQECVHGCGGKKGKKSSRRLRRRCEDNIKMSLKEKGLDGVELVDEAASREQLPACVSTIMLLRVPQNFAIFWGVD